MLTALQYEDTQIKPDPKTLSEAQHTGAEWSEVDKRNVRSDRFSHTPQTTFGTAPICAILLKNL